MFWLPPGGTDNGVWACARAELADLNVDDVGPILGLLASVDVGGMSLRRDGFNTRGPNRHRPPGGPGDGRIRQPRPQQTSLLFWPEPSAWPAVQGVTMRPRRRFIASTPSPLPYRTGASRSPVIGNGAAPLRRAPGATAVHCRCCPPDPTLSWPFPPLLPVVIVRRRLPNGGRRSREKRRSDRQQYGGGQPSRPRVPLAK
jgi:hypothetical protein